MPKKGFKKLKPFQQNFKCLWKKPFKFWINKDNKKKQYHKLTARKIS